MGRIQIIVIFINLLFIAYISRLIIKAKLREEYAIIWTVFTLLLFVFAFWRKGLDVAAKMFGVYEPANLVFTAFIFIILIYLLHLSVVNSKLQKNITKISQELALLKEEKDKTPEHK